MNHPLSRSSRGRLLFLTVEAGHFLERGNDHYRPCVPLARWAGELPRSRHKLRADLVATPGGTFWPSKLLVFYPLQLALKVVAVDRI